MMASPRNRKKPKVDSIHLRWGTVSGGFPRFEIVSFKLGDDQRRPEIGKDCGRRDCWLQLEAQAGVEFEGQRRAAADDDRPSGFLGSVATGAPSWFHHAALGAKLGDLADCPDVVSELAGLGREVPILLDEVLSRWAYLSPV